MWFEEEYMLRVLRLNLIKIKATGLLSSHLKGGGCINTHILHIHVCLKVQHLCFWKIRIDFKNCASTFIWKKGKQMKIKPTELYHERTQEGWRSKCFYFGAMRECHGSETNEIIHSSLFKFRELGQSHSLVAWSTESLNWMSRGICSHEAYKIRLIEDGMSSLCIFPHMVGFLCCLSSPKDFKRCYFLH